MQEYLAMWKNYANFGDRTSRRGYWMAVLFNMLVSLILYALVSIAPVLAVLYGAYGLATLIPGLALTVRRLRDAGKSWGFLFLLLIPLVGSIVVLIFLCQKTSNFEGEQV